MFSFFHRSSVVTLDCFTSDRTAYDFTPIVKSSKTHPEFWKKLPKPNVELHEDDKEILVLKSKDNLKNCRGYLDYFSNSISLRHWTDLYVSSTPQNYTWYIKYGDSPTSHNAVQYEGAFENYHHLKLMSPWIFREKTGINFVWVGSEWNLDKFDFKILPGVLEFRVNTGLNVNIMLPKRENSYIINAGLSLVNLFPMTEKRVKICNHLVSSEEMTIYRKNPNTSYFHGWRTAKKILDSTDDKRKCPFGFGE